jgi:hypothetical protein
LKSWIRPYTDACFQIDHINNTRNTDVCMYPRHFSDLMRWHFWTKSTNRVPCTI